MPYRKTKKKLLLYLLIILLVLYFLPDRFKNSLQMQIVRIVSPLLSFFNNKTVAIKERVSFYFNAKKIIKENKSLKKQVAFLNSMLADKVELEKENERLHKILKLRKKFKNFKTIAANVIARDPLNWKKSIIIDKGYAEGVKYKSPVISVNGLVGIVFNVGKHQSKVLLINDSMSKVGVIVQRTRSMGVVEGGNANKLILKYVDKDADIRTGDILITSGLGSIYPKGIRVGVVNKIFESRMHLFKYAEVMPSVDFSRLEEVLVIKSILGNEILERDNKHKQKSVKKQQ